MLTMREVGTFTVLLLICMTIFTLLGMELFGHRVRFNLDNNIDPENPGTLPPRANFDSFGYAFTTIFIVFIGEDW